MQSRTPDFLAKKTPRNEEGILIPQPMKRAPMRQMSGTSAGSGSSQSRRKPAPVEIPSSTAWVERLDCDSPSPCPTRADDANESPASSLGRQGAERFRRGRPVASTSSAAGQPIGDDSLVVVAGSLQGPSVTWLLTIARPGTFDDVIGRHCVPVSQRVYEV